MIDVRVRFFAGHRDIVGASERSYRLPSEATLGMLWEQLCAEFPRLSAYNGRLLFARNQEFAQPSDQLSDGDEVAFIPPVSGGSGFRPFMISETALDAAPLIAFVQTPSDGAVTTFAGVARDNFGGRATARLSYQAYLEMAEPVLAQIAQEAQERFAIGRVAIHHRIGTLEIGETAVLVVVASPHREASFAAVAYIMDRIKAIAPIWKAEHWADGEQEWRE